MVGYDLNAPVPYFLLKNAWGTEWGEGGYYKFAIGELSESNYGMCNIANSSFNIIPVIE